MKSITSCFNKNNLKPKDGCEDKPKLSKDELKDLQEQIATLELQIQEIKDGIASEHFTPEEMINNNITTWNEEKQKLETTIDPESLALKSETNLAIDSVIDGTTPVTKISEVAVNTNNIKIATSEDIKTAITPLAKLTDVEKETQDRSIADVSIISGKTPVQVISVAAEDELGNKIAKYDKNLPNGLVEYQDGILVQSTTDITEGLNKEIADRTEADNNIKTDITSLSLRMSTDEGILASEMDERKMITDLLTTEVSDLTTDVHNIDGILAQEAADRMMNDDSIIDGTTPVIKVKAGCVDTEGNVLATSDDALMLYGSQGPDNIKEYESLDDIKLCGQKCVTKDSLAATIANKPNGVSGPFDLIVGYFNADSRQPYQVYVDKTTKDIFFRFSDEGYFEEKWHKLLTTTV